MEIAVIGGGAAGFFLAIACAEANPGCRITIFERGKSVLEKVRISGGGRCNVTHACFDPKNLIQFYPRGGQALLGPFMRFGPQQTIDWFDAKGVTLKTEPDGRMFPISDDSNTIVQCLQRCARQLGVCLRTHARVEKIIPPDQFKSWQLKIQHEPELQHFDRVAVTSGSNPAIWDLLKSIGLNIVEPVPSLFTFHVKDPRIQHLMGVSVPLARLRIPGTTLHSEGALLITHWGFSGPGVLRLSAWGARALHANAYQFPLEINWLGNETRENVLRYLADQKHTNGKKWVASRTHFELPLRLWEILVQNAGISSEMRWGDLDKKRLQALGAELVAGAYQVRGKSTFKEEFVTAGGVNLDEINFKKFESKKHPGLFLAGEVLDIDAITGGFNFQAAWTGGWIAGQAIAQSL